MAQKALISLITSAAAELNLPMPTAVMSSQDQNVQKLLAITRAVCDDLLVEHDWQVLQTRYSFSTINGQESYTLPTGIDRFISCTFFDQNNRWEMQGPKTPAEWEWLKASSYIGVPFTQYRIYGDKLYVNPVPGTSAYTFNMEYISSYYVKDGGGGVNKADFTQDSDICLFDHRMVVYGIKLKMRESLGLDTTSNVSDYKRALEFAKGSDEPARTLHLLGGSAFRTITNANIPDGSWS